MKWSYGDFIVSEIGLITEPFSSEYNLLLKFCLFTYTGSLPYFNHKLITIPDSVGLRECKNVYLRFDIITEKKFTL